MDTMLSHEALRSGSQTIAVQLSFLSPSRNFFRQIR